MLQQPILALLNLLREGIKMKHMDSINVNCTLKKYLYNQFNLYKKEVYESMGTVTYFTFFA